MMKVEIYGGKGGVGKTTLSTARANLYALKGMKVLLVSTDPAHSISDVLGYKVGSSISNIKQNLDALEIDPEKEARSMITRIRSDMSSILSPVIMDEVQKQLNAAQVMPGTHESSLFDRMMHLIDEQTGKYDVIIFDTAPTGHTLRLLTLPGLLVKWLDSLIEKRKRIVKLKDMIGIAEEDIILERLIARRDFTRKSGDFINSESTTIHLVMNPEKMPFEETKKAYAFLNEYSLKVSEIIVNKILPHGISDEFFKSRYEKEENLLKQIENEFKGCCITRIPLMKSDMDFLTINEVIQVLDK